MSKFETDKVVGNKNGNDINVDSIEEDIKRLNNIIKKCDECKFATCEQCEINWTDVQPIKTVLGNLEALCDMQRSENKENEILKEKVKELEKALLKVKDRNTTLFITCRNSIPKQKIKDKIEELNKQEQELQNKMLVKM